MVYSQLIDWCVIDLYNGVLSRQDAPGSSLTLRTSKRGGSPKIQPRLKPLLQRDSTQEMALGSLSEVSPRARATHNVSLRRRSSQSGHKEEP
jgi:hypothetical protein